MQSGLGILARAALAIALARGAARPREPRGRGAARARRRRSSRSSRLLKRKLEVKRGGRRRQGASVTPIVGAGTDGFFLRSPDSKPSSSSCAATSQFDGRCFDASGERRRHRHLRVPPRAADRRGHGRASTSTSGSCPTSRAARSSLHDAYANLQLLARCAQLQVGKFKAPVGLERLQSATAPDVRRARAARRSSCRTATSACSSRATCARASSATRSASSTASRDSGNAELDDVDTQRRQGRRRARLRAPVPEHALRAAAGPRRRRRRRPGARRTRRAADLPHRRPADLLHATAAHRTRCRPRCRRRPLAPRRRRRYWYWGPFGLLGEYVAARTSSCERGAGNAHRGRRTTPGRSRRATCSPARTRPIKGVDPALGRSTLDGQRLGRLRARGPLRPSSDSTTTSSPGFANPATVGAQALASGRVGVNWYLNRCIKLVARTTSTRRSTAARRDGAIATAESACS